MQWIKRFGFVFLVCIIVCCSQKDPVSGNNILVKVGSKTITTQDFIRRSEYAIRPNYCKQTNYIHKKIILNSLIAEKLFALEADNNRVDLLENDRFQLFITGRTEQTMRQIHYYENYYDNVELDSVVINRAYKLAGRTVNVTFLNLPDLKTAFQTIELSKQGISLDSIYTSVWNEETSPTREINWFDPLDESIHKELFDSDMKKGSILGPFPTGENSFLVFQITGWTDKLAVTDSDRSLRRKDVQERLQKNEAEKQYKFWVKSLMKDKQLDMNPNVFPSYAADVIDLYFRSDSAKRAQLSTSIWSSDQELEFISDSLETLPDKTFKKSDILFSVDDRKWTVEDFHKKLDKHPLVFRKKKMNRGEFSEQLKYAIADLLQDIEITKTCYSKGYDKSETVKLNTTLWQDAYSARYYRDIFLKDWNITSGDNHTIATLLDPVVDSLQIVYSDIIEVNTDVFEKIELTNVDMIVHQKGVPYPKLVPSFPIFTTDDRLDYGSKLD